MLYRNARALGKAPAGFVILGIAGDGDSIDYGLGATHSFLYYFTQNAGIATNNQGIPGATLVGLESTYSSRGIGALYNAGSCNLLTQNGASNDFAGSASLISVKNAASAYVADGHGSGFKVGLITTIARGSITGGNETNRVSYNTWLRAGGSGADYVIDFDAVPQSQDPTNLTYFQSDQVHPTDAQHQLLAVRYQADLGL